jgi:energy-coupling factor transporter ATP-binding protein EcfA2
MSALLERDPVLPVAAGDRVSGLAKSFPGPVRAVRGIDLAIAPGETVALLGPNGAGKSTTIDMLLGLTRPDAGTVTVFGRDPAAAIAAGDVGADPVRRARRPARAHPDRRLRRRGDRRAHRAVRAAGRHLVSAAQQRVPAQPRPGPALLLACAGEPHRHRRAPMAGHRMDRRRGLDRRRCRARRPRLPPRHGARLMRSCPAPNQHCRTTDDGVSLP